MWYADGEQAQVRRSSTWWCSARGWRFPPEVKDLAQRQHGRGADPAQFRADQRLLAGGDQPPGHLPPAAPWPVPRTSPLSVMEASAAACAAAGNLTRARGSLTKTKEVPRPWMFPARRPEGRRFCLLLRHQHRRRGGCGRGLRIRQEPCPTWPIRGEQPVQLLPGHPGQGGPGHQGPGPEPGGGGGMHPQDPRAAVPGNPAGCGPEQIPVRHGQHPQPGFLGARRQPRNGHGQGQGPGPHGGGQGLAFEPAERG